MSILDEIALRTVERVSRKKEKLPLTDIMKIAESISIEKDFPFEKALNGDDIAFICEVKKASPTKGVIAEDFPYLQIAKEYETSGAAAVSVLTEPYYFQGSDDYLAEISKEITIPILRKDFTVDQYMIYEAKLLGSDAILLICALLDIGRLAEYISIAHSLGLSALVETHTEKEVEMALNAGARIIGVNNRNLNTFEVDLSTSEILRRLVPKDKIFISESGINTPEDVERLRKIGANAALVGEAFMRSPDKKLEFMKLRGGRVD